VDEASPVGSGRRAERTRADLAWQALGAAVFRLPGIYGPGRSAIDQVRAGTARRVDSPGQRFNRIHVDDIAGAVLRAADAGFTGVLNVVDELPAEPRHVTEFACRLLGVAPPPLAALDFDSLRPMAHVFWKERRLVSGHLLKRALGYRLRHPDYKAGLSAIRKGAAR
jgi:nucleoside-diphosphate-sugar epimerase